MDKRTLLAVVICMGIFLGWQKYYIEPRMPKPAPHASSTQSTATGNVTSAAPGTATSLSPATTPATQPDRPLQTETIALAQGTATISNSKHFFADWNLTKYHHPTALDSAGNKMAVDLKSVINQSGAATLSFDDAEFAYLDSARGALEKTEKGWKYTYEDARVKITRTYQPTGDNSHLDVTLSAEFKQRAPKFAFVSLTGQSYDKDPEAQDRQLLYFTQDKIHRVQLHSSVEVSQVSTPVGYIAAQDRYFALALVPQSTGAVAVGAEAKGLIQPTQTMGGRINLVYPVTGNALVIPLKAYFGPKELENLRAVDKRLDHAVDFGMFVVIAYPLLKLLKFFYALFHNYGIAIILLTLLVKLGTYPLTYKSMKSMRKMAVLQPQIQKLREKHKDDPQALNREMMTLMKSGGYNPLAGCLPILVQMPVFFALYRVLYSSIELYQAPFMLWITDLAAKDSLYVTPLLLTITMYFQQKLTPNTSMDPMQAKMLQFMPVIFGVFMLTLPSGLTLYMLVNALASIVQQLILNKKLGPMPQVAPALSVVKK